MCLLNTSARVSLCLDKRSSPIGVKKGSNIRLAVALVIKTRTLLELLMRSCVWALATQTCNTPVHTEKCKIHYEATSSAAWLHCNWVRNATGWWSCILYLAQQCTSAGSSRTIRIHNFIIIQTYFQFQMPNLNQLKLSNFQMTKRHNCPHKPDDKM